MKARQTTIRSKTIHYFKTKNWNVKKAFSTAVIRGTKNFETKNFNNSLNFCLGVGSTETLCASGRWYNLTMKFLRWDTLESLCFHSQTFFQFFFSLLKFAVDGCFFCTLKIIGKSFDSAMSVETFVNLSNHKLLKQFVRHENFCSTLRGWILHLKLHICELISFLIKWYCGPKDGSFSLQSQKISFSYVFSAVFQAVYKDDRGASSLAKICWRSVFVGIAFILNTMYFSFILNLKNELKVNLNFLETKRLKASNKNYRHLLLIWEKVPSCQ